MKKRSFSKHCFLILVVCCALFAFIGCAKNIVVRAPGNESFTTDNVKAEKIILNCYQREMQAGSSFSLFATVWPSKYQAACTYTSDNPQVASVNDSGVVSANAAGKATVTVRCGSLSAQCGITVTGDAPSTSPSVNPSTGKTTDSSTVGNTSSLPSSGTDPNTVSSPASSPAVSSSPASESSLPATSAATSPASETPSANSSSLPVSNTATESPSSPVEFIPIEGIEIIGPTDAYIGREYTYTIRVTPENATEEYTLHNSNARVSSLSETGVLTTTGKGKTTITVETETSGLSDSIQVNIVPYIIGVSYKVEKTTIMVGETVHIQALILPEGTVNSGAYWVKESKKAQNGGDVSLSYEPKSIDCYVTGVHTGKIAITIGSQDYDSMTKTVWFTVVPDTTPKISVEASSYEMDIGTELTPVITTANIKGTLKYSSDNPDCAKINSEGVITALSEGSAKITVSDSDSSASATFTVNVIAVPKLTLEEESLNLTVGEVGNITATLVYSTAKLIYQTDNPAIVTVDDSGHITALSDGVAHITVSTDDHTLSAVCTVTVNPLPDPDPEPEPTPEPENSTENSESTEEDLPVSTDPSEAS